jgi:hypothetical protein
MIGKNGRGFGSLEPIATISSVNLRERGDEELLAPRMDDSANTARARKLKTANVQYVSSFLQGRL